MTKKTYTPTWGEELEQVTFFRTYWESIQELEHKDQLELFYAIMQYCFCGTEPTFTASYLKAIWCTMKANLYKSCTRTYVGRLGGAPKGNTNARKKQPTDTPNPAEADNRPDHAGASRQSGAEGEPRTTDTMQEQESKGIRIGTPLTDPFADMEAEPPTDRPTIPAEEREPGESRTAHHSADPSEPPRHMEASTAMQGTENTPNNDVDVELCKSFVEYWKIGRRSEADKRTEWNAWKSKGEAYRTAMMQFANWWELYDKKVDKQKCITHWLRLKPAEREEAIRATPAYVASTPEKRYRKDPYTWLNRASWTNELITPSAGADTTQNRPNPAEATTQTDYKELRKRLMQGTEQTENRPNPADSAGYPVSKYRQAKERLINTPNNDEQEQSI